MKKFKGLIFDFNGVLLLDQHLHDEIWKKVALEIRDREITDDEVKKIFHGRTNRSVLEYLLGRPVENEELQERAAKKELLYQDLAKTMGSEYRLSPGAATLLNYLHEHNVAYTIATSSPAMNIPFFNTMLGLDQWFDMGKIAFDDGTLRGKPAPDLYLRAAQLLSLEPRDCVVIEDASSGIAAAHAAGIGHIIAIGPRDSHETLRKMEGVSEVIEQLTEVDTSRLF